MTQHITVLTGSDLASLMPFGSYVDEIMIFDGCGVGIQDVAAAACAFELARKYRAGSRITL